MYSIVEPIVEFLGEGHGDEDMRFITRAGTGRSQCMGLKHGRRGRSRVTCYRSFTGSRGASRMSLSAFDPLTKRKARPRLADGPVRSAAGDEPMVPLTRLDQVLLQP